MLTSPGFTVSGGPLTVDESGTWQSFTVVLDTAPENGDVVFDVSTGDDTESNVDVTSLTFTSWDWDTPQTVRVTGEDDSVDDGHIAHLITAAVNSTSDTAFASLDDKTVTVTTTDNDTAGFTLSDSLLIVDESGGSQTFDVVLDAAPENGDVLLIVTTSDPSESSVDVVLFLMFTSADWNMPQPVTVSGVDDFVDDGDVHHQVDVSVSLASDIAFISLPPKSIFVNTLDDDDPPEFDAAYDPDQFNWSLDEDAAADTVVDQLTVEANSLTPTFAITSERLISLSSGLVIPSSPAFTIDSTTGQVRTKSTLPADYFDFESGFRYELDVSVTNSAGSGTGLVNITISDVNEAPVIETAPGLGTIITGPISGVELEYFTFHFLVLDADDFDTPLNSPPTDPLTITATDLPPGISLSILPWTGPPQPAYWVVLAGQLTYSAAGSYDSTITATDSDGLIGTYSFTWQITDSPLGVIPLRGGGYTDVSCCWV
jgi:hypothetical protein